MFAAFLAIVLNAFFQLLLRVAINIIRFAKAVIIALLGLTVLLCNFCCSRHFVLGYTA